MSSHKPVVLITGANTGLGYATAKALCQSPIAYIILLCGRDLEKAKEAANKLQEECPSTESQVVPQHVDVEDDSSIEKLAQEVEKEYGRVDVLINNAGAGFESAMAAGEMTTREAWSKSWDVNVTGAHLMTSAIVPLLFKSPAPRLIFVTSGPSSLSESEDPANKWNYSPPAGWPKTHVYGKVVLGYRCAKTGLNMLAREWTRLLKNDPVKVLCVSPGFMATKLNRMPPEKLKMIGAVDPIVGGNFLKDVIEGKKDNAEGKVIRQNGIQPW